MLSFWVTIRQLRRSPAHIAAVVLSLGIGMAICGAVFSLLSALLFAAVPGIVNRTSIIHIRWNHGDDHLTETEFETIHEDLAPVLDGVAAQGERRLSVMLPSGPATTTVAFVSRNLFQTLGTAATVGRLLTVNDNADTVALSETLWRHQYNADPNVVGRTVAIAGRPFTIVGVSPSGFPGLRLIDQGTDPESTPQLWVPLPSTSGNTPWLSVGGRLPTGVDLKTFQARLFVTAQHTARLSAVRHELAVFQWFRGGLSWTDNPGGSLATLAVFLMVPLSILAIGCANMINLQLARATERAQELSVRLTLGASRVQLFRLLSVEVTLLTGLAGAVGWIGARLFLRAVQPLLAVPLALDRTALWFLLILIAAVIATAGCAPAWLALRHAIAVGVRQGGDSVPHKRLRAALVVAQVAGSVVLLFISSLGIRTLQAQHAKLPENAKDILTAEFDLSQWRQPPTNPAVFVESVLTQLRDRGPTREAAFATFLRFGQPVQFWLSSDGVQVRRTVYAGAVTRDWFGLMGIRVLAGHTFGGSQSLAEIVVNETFASQLGGRSAVLGTRLRVRGIDGAVRTYDVVGVVEDHVMSAVPMALVAMPATPPPALVLLVRTTDAATALPMIRTAINAADPLAPLDAIRPLSVEVTQAFSGLAQLVHVGLSLGALAALLAALGQYSVLAFSVSRRTREIGIRVAVGANRRTVLGMIVRQALIVTVAGLVLGFCLAVPVSITMRSAFYGVSPVDPLAMMPVLMTMILVGVVASLLPAFRATSVDPAVALRDE